MDGNGKELGGDSQVEFTPEDLLDDEDKEVVFTPEGLSENEEIEKIPIKSNIDKRKMN